MSFTNVIWIDSESEIIESSQSFFKDTHHFQQFSKMDMATLNSINWNHVDLLLMELVLHHEDMIHWVSKIREKKPVLPILAITSHATKENCIQAINLGINSLIEKPVDHLTLKKFFEKFQTQKADLKMCHDRKAIFSQGTWVDLTSTEYKILETLKTAQKRLTRAELQSSVWPNSSISENNLDTHLTNLKRKIPELNQILNVKRGLGYYLELTSKV